jgi:hypothetical protein
LGGELQLRGWQWLTLCGGSADGDGDVPFRALRGAVNGNIFGRFRYQPLTLAQQPLELDWAFCFSTTTPPNQKIGINDSFVCDFQVSENPSTSSISSMSLVFLRLLPVTPKRFFVTPSTYEHQPEVVADSGTGDVSRRSLRYHTDAKRAVGSGDVEVVFQDRDLH